MSTLQKIKSLRNQKGLSQSKMAELIGISQTGYAKIESGGTDSIALSVAVGIAKALDVGFNELFNIDGDSRKIDSLSNEIEQLKNRIIEIEEQLRDKRTIIDLLFSSEFVSALIPDFDHNKSREQNLIDLFTKNKKSWEDLKS